MCVCMYIYIYAYTSKHIYICIYFKYVVCLCVYVNISNDVSNLWIFCFRVIREPPRIMWPENRKKEKNAFYLFRVNIFVQIIICWIACSEVNYTLFLNRMHRSLILSAPLLMPNERTFIFLSIVSSCFFNSSTSGPKFTYEGFNESRDWTALLKG